MSNPNIPLTGARRRWRRWALDAFHSPAGASPGGRNAVGVSFRYSFRVVPYDVQAGRNVPIASALKMRCDL